MKIEYGDAKNQRNIQGRELAFNRAVELNCDMAAIIEDVRYNYPERRFVATGYLGKRVFHCDREWNSVDNFS